MKKPILSPQDVIGDLEADASHGPRTLRTVLAWGFFVAALIPVNFVTLSAFWQRTDNFLVTALATLSIFAIACNRRLRLKLLVSLGALFATATLASGDPQAVVTFLMPFFIGAGVASITRRRDLRSMLITMTAALMISVFIDGVLHFPASSAIFGVPNQISDLTGTRARGFLGQPVPAAFASLVLFAALTPSAVASKRLRTRVLAVSALGFQLVATLFFTGTRSAFILALAVAATFVVRYGMALGTKFLGPLLLASPALLVAAILLYWQAGSEIQKSRLGDFDGLNGSTSLSNRLLAVEYLQRWASSGDVLALLIGKGPRALQGTLSANRGNYLSTIDNFFVTLLWDFGLVGAALLLLALYVLSRKILSKNSFSAGAAIGGITLVASSFAFDVLYVRPLALLFMLMAAACLDDPVAGKPQEQIKGQPGGTNG